MKTRTPISIRIAAIIIINILIFEVSDTPDYFRSPLFWGMLIIFILLVLIADSIMDLVESTNFKMLSEEEKKQYLEDKAITYFRKLWNAAFKKQTDKEEKSLLIDHGFDGITELDNALPKWWLGLFYFTITYCLVYLVAFAFTDYAHPDAEYKNEAKAQLASISEYEKTAPAIDIDNAVYSSDNIAEGEHIFKTNCVSCHSAGGKGGIGPNLTDKYWINIKQKSLFKNVFWMLQNGSPNNPTMKAFIKEGIITSRDAEKVAAYIYHINQEQTPITESQGGAAPQGQEATWENNK
ncbi:cbb3-type cytochrome c oxidase N-terminal domain-containing protein [Epilithonimonas pallida]|uniref:Cytochrome c oxidase cbb3-type subunit 3 n=1 Tax=Epilithonimonas pallida TaxID=373671 RepID=A0ABY1R6Q3_9FLAO|nr:cbb3-type cytochrome c oxidase N-terminal domain-containing protein [Epilithonimonas pallida]SMP97538.1 cytochrome c oxidase cbb3-type subunit 3 [Epilithonimonas pallida]